MLSQAQWQEYIDVLNQFHESAADEIIVWNRKFVERDLHGEDSNIRLDNVNLKCLVLYNYFRSWPITQGTDSGDIDKQSILVYFNLDYLDSLNLLNSSKQFMFDPGYDRFTLRGIIYKPMGDSHVAQAGTRPTSVFIVLKKEETPTGSETYNNG